MPQSEEKWEGVFTTLAQQKNNSGNSLVIQGIGKSNFNFKFQPLGGILLNLTEFMFFAPLLCKMEGLTHQALLVLIPLEENKIQLPHFKALSLVVSTFK